MSTQSKSDNPQFTWIPFYTKLADKLLEYKDRRGELLEKLKALDKGWIPHLWDKETDNWKFKDIDPFSVFAILNRRSDLDIRCNIAKKFKNIFQIQEESPVDFAGIPILQQKSLFFAKENVKTDINPLWDLFESAINGSKNVSFIQSLDRVLKQKEIGWSNITIALYWIRPYDYITLDSKTQTFLIDNGIQIPKLTADNYLELIDTLQNDSNFMNKSFPEISLEAWYNKHVPNEDKDNEEKNENLFKDKEFNKKVKEIADVLGFKKNIILQGAPGTGKTYITAAVTLKTLGVVDDNFDFSDHPAVMEKYEECREKKKIFFTTFHQSMDYEDFVEGFKPKLAKDKDGNAIGVNYEVADGIFREVCRAAIVSENSGEGGALTGINSNPTIWKVSLEGTGDNPTRTDCLENNHIRIGWGTYGDVDFDSLQDFPSGGKAILRSFQSKMRIGDIVLSCYSAQEIDAIGVVTGDYEYHKEGGLYPRYRKVRWIVKNIRENILELNQDHALTLATVYRLKIPLSDIVAIIQKHSAGISYSHNDMPVVLIIDEINRGNVSKIFGELITLIEADKRSGGDRSDTNHTISLKLPYSGEKNFSVPSNVYIIGTMNTTDRSTGTIDYAIRRRFAFVTLEANPNVIQDEKARALFNDIKSFIKNDKNHPQDMDINDLMVGHSYFMADNEVKLKLKIQYEVIPLLKEYFNDGLLTCSQEELDKRIESWMKLKVYGSSETQDSASSKNPADAAAEAATTNDEEGIEDGDGDNLEG